MVGRRRWRIAAGSGPAAARARRRLALLGGAAVVLAGLLVLLLRQGVYPFPYRPVVIAAARSNHLDPLLLAAVIRTESGFRPQAASSRQALGLMQIVPSTGAWIAGRMGRTDFDTLSLLDPAYNVQLGAWYLATLQRGFGGRLPPALAAYNAGQAVVASWLASGVWSGDLRGAGSIPFPETRQFVRRVLASYRMYRMLYPYLNR